MKKYAFLIALCGLAAFSCNKEENVADVNNLPEKTIHFTAVAGKTDMKTVVDDSEGYANWLATDELAIKETLSYTLDETPGTIVNSGEAAVSNSVEWYVTPGYGKSAEFEATIISGSDIPSGAILNEASYVAAYPKGALSQNNEKTFYRMMMPEAQSPIVGSFDPAADLLLSAPAQKSDKSRVTDGDKLSFQFHRLGTAVKLTLKGITANEKLKSVTVEAPENIAGYLKVDLGNADYIGGSAPYSNQSKTITLTLNDWVVSGDVVVWFRVAAGTWKEGDTMKVSVVTDAATYYRDGSHESSAITIPAGGLVFADGGRTSLPVSLATEYGGVRVEGSTSLPEGNYVILAKNGEDYYAMKAVTVSSDTRMASVAYTGSLDSYSGDADMVWNVSKSGSSYIIANDGKYLGYGGSDNKASWLEPGEEWTTTNYLINIAWDSTKNCYHATANGFSGRKLSRNSNSNWFAFYTTSQQEDLVFVPAAVDSRTAVTFSFAEDVVNLTTANYDTFIGQDVTIDPASIAAISEHLVWEYSNADGIIDETQSSEYAIQLNGTTGTATVTVSFAGDTDYRAASASYTINVTDGIINYATLETSNVTLSTDGGTNANTATVNGKDALKAGTSKKDGSLLVTVPAGTTNLHVHAVAWKDENNTTVTISGASVTPASISLTSNDALTGSGTSYTITGVADYYFNLSLSDITAETTLTFSSTKRFVIWGINAVADTRDDPGMSWSASAATATYTTGNNLSFSAPTLALGNASSVSYASSDETIATIDAASGAITVNLTDNDVKEGSTTISASFAGDTDYKPQTVSYTLNVVDNRDAVATPTFDPAAGEVTADTEVAFQCADAGVTFYYTVDGSAPTTASSSGNSVTISAACTVKVIAVKNGYKNSAVASADYTIAGAYETLPFEESFASSKGSFTINDISNPDNLSAIWTTNSTYMKATSYSGSNHDAESWLISPLIQLPSLASGESVKLKFEQCVNKYFGTISDEATLWAKTESGSWTKIDITYPAVSGTWSSFELQIIDLSAYAGEKIQFAFKYVGSSTTAGTWEVKNVSVKKYDPLALSSISVSGQKANFKVGDSFSFGGTVTAHYNDESTADVTASATFTGYDMSTAGEQTVTVSYTEGSTKTTTYNITVSDSAGPSTYSSTFTSASWASTGDFSWKSGKAGAGFNNNGIQVTSNASYSGANATTNKTFTGVTQVVVTYNTNKSAGAGTLVLKVGSNADHTEDWAYSSGDGRSANYTCTFTIDPAESGAIKLTANTTTNSIYIVSVAVTATNME